MYDRNRGGKSMNNDIFYNILKQIEERSYLKADDIPSLDLYMDQIMTLFDVNLTDNKRYESDKLLTKTMINNYSKDGLLQPIKGKKYTKEHILQMLLIYSLKNTISIQEIKKVLKPYHNSHESIEKVYNDFLSHQNELSHSLTMAIKKYVKDNQFNLDDPQQLTTLLLLICTLSNQLKSIAEKMLDTYYIEDKK